VPKLTADFVEALPIDGQDRTYADTSLPGFYVRVTPAGAKIFMARARSGNGRTKVKIGEFPATSVNAARNEAHAILRDVRDGKNPTAEKHVRRAALQASKTTVSELADRWLAEFVRPKLKPRTIADYEKIVDDRIKPRLGAMAVSAVSKSDVIAWHAAMSNTPRRANYIISTFRALMSFAEDVGLRQPHTNPAKRIAMYREQKRERFLSEEELQKAASAITKAEEDKAIGPHAAAGLRLALFTGARSGEIVAIEWSHIDWHRKMVRLPDSKTNTPRTIHLSNAALEVLKAIPKVGTFVIAGAKKDEPYKNLGRAWIIARKHAGLDDVRLHDLRHSFASWAINRNFSLAMVGKLLGHRVPATTQRYAHLARDVVSDINEEIGTAMTAAIAKASARSSLPVKPLKAGKRRS